MAQITGFLSFPIRITLSFILFSLVACQKGGTELPPLEVDPNYQVPGFIQYGDKQVYLNGANLAWFNFAMDFGNGVDEVRLREALGEIQAAGGNSLRWWLHTDGALTPEWGVGDKANFVVGPGKHTIPDLRQALDIAAEYEIYIIPSLWSFDMLRKNDFRKPPTQKNFTLLVDDAVLKSYIDNALAPMVKALNSHPQLIAWELFNEPENMTETWFFKQPEFYGGHVPSLTRLQRVQALMAAGIHRAAQQQGEIALVTTGSKSTGKYNSDVAGGINLYSDERMINAADGDKLAVLDFYAPHYYNNEGKDGAWSPFHRHVSFWQLDKPVVIGEYHVEDLDVMSAKVKAKGLCKRLRENGYAGGWPWQWIQHKKHIKACLKLNK